MDSHLLEGMGEGELVQLVSAVAYAVYQRAVHICDRTLIDSAPTGLVSERLTMVPLGGPVTGI